MCRNVSYPSYQQTVLQAVAQSPLPTTCFNIIVFLANSVGSRQQEGFSLHEIAKTRVPMLPRSLKLFRYFMLIGSKLDPPE